jgi:transposase
VLTPRSTRIFLALEPTKLANGIDGLAGLVTTQFGDDPLSGAVFVFFNRRRNAVKLLVWDTGGFVLLHKRLERGRFRIPKAMGTKVRLTPAELAALLEGIDLSRARRLPRWNPPDAGQDPVGTVVESPTLVTGASGSAGSSNRERIAPSPPGAARR